MDCQLLTESLHRSGERCRVVATATRMSEARSILNQKRPHVALISPQLAEGPLVGFDLLREIRERLPGVQPIIILEAIEPRMTIYSFQMGARGIFSRDRSVHHLAKCIEVVHQGQIWASTTELQIILQAMAQRTRFEPKSAAGAKLLTHREEEVATLVASGMRNQEISIVMRLSTHTVKNYLHRVFEKLGISSRVELTTRVLAEAGKKTRKGLSSDQPEAAG